MLGILHNLRERKRDHIASIGVIPTLHPAVVACVDQVTRLYWGGLRPPLPFVLYPHR
jgi:hypothetical protein